MTDRESILEMMREYGKAVYGCGDCGELFDRDDIWHCPVCDHHWPARRLDCWNCHAYDRPRKLKPLAKVEA